MFKKVLVANRGEIAVRLVQVLHELEAEAVVVYSQADQDSLAVALADTAICIGPAPAAQSYLNMQNVLEAAVLTGAEAIHPGFGFLSESADFAELCEQAGIVFIGPASTTIAALGDKAAARQFVSGLGVPVIPGSQAVFQLAEARVAAEACGYPLMLKAAAGGGGKGIRLIADVAALEAAWPAAQQEALAAFGESGMYLEKVLQDAKHLEVQVLGDAEGNVWTFPERDCSLQAGKQKLIEFSPAIGVATAKRQALQRAAARIAKACHYQNAGTVEFLVDASGVYFMEMNTRIQVEHPITEAVCGVDLLRLQIELAAGATLEGPAPQAKGVAIECRLNATAAAGAPQIESLRWPLGGAGVRIDTGITAGMRLNPYYDAMLAKLIVHADSAELAWRRLTRVLMETQITGVATNLTKQLQLLSAPTVRAGAATITYVEEAIHD